jgi:TrmH family RNA methyltransferase
MSNKWLKHCRSLQQKKYRKLHRHYLAEGAKIVAEVLQYAPATVEQLFCTEAFAEQHWQLLTKTDYTLAKADWLVKAGTLSSNTAAIAVAAIPELPELRLEKELVLALDDLSDPGNLGTILRLADWYGINKLICSPTTVDVYNPKVIAASMGSYLRVSCYYLELPQWLESLPNTVQKLGAFMQGETIHGLQVLVPAVLVIGNEANGIGRATAQAIATPVTIPRKGTAESLNAAMATAILLDNLIYR